MNYIYSIMWLVIGIYLCFFVSKGNKLIVFLSFYFFFSAAWWFIDAATPLELFVSPYTWIFRAVSVVVLAIGVIGYLILKKRASAQKTDGEHHKEPDKKQSEEDNKD